MLTNKTAFITGATKGIGLEIANTFAHNNANLILSANNQKDLQIIQRKLQQQYNIDVYIIAFDIANYNEIKNGLKQVLQYTKSIDILVNNAGILKAAKVGMIDRQSIEDTYKTNVYSIYEISQYIARVMKRKKQGSIINISSIMGVFGAAEQSIYAGSKAAVIGITKSMSKELAQDNIRVNTLAPGFIKTKMTNTINPQLYKEYINKISMKKVGTPKDVANCALFLASDLSSYVTGQILGVDGGMII